MVWTLGVNSGQVSFFIISQWSVTTKILSYPIMIKLKRNFPKQKGTFVSGMQNCSWLALFKLVVYAKLVLL